MFSRLMFNLAVVGWLLGSFPLFAVFFEPLSISELSRQADVVVHGTVAQTTCLRDPAGRIYTRVDLQVSDIWKGAISGTPFPIVHGGGGLGNEQSLVSGQVSYAVGEEVVAFLVRNDRGEGVTLGLLQGKFHVWKEANTGIKLASSPFHSSLASSAIGRGLQLASSTASSAQPLRLSDLKKLVVEGRP